MPEICKWKFFERLEYKKKKIHAAGKKDAGGDEKLLIFFTWPKGYAISTGKFLKSKVFTTQCLAFIKMHF
jgi:hypothetical protein